MRLHYILLSFYLSNIHLTRLIGLAPTQQPNNHGRTLPAPVRCYAELTNRTVFVRFAERRPFICFVQLFHWNITYWAGNVLYNKYLHPLRKFPGPKLAACSILYEFYWDVLKRGKYLWQINHLHEMYGK